MEHNSLWNWLARAVAASVHYIIQRINKSLMPLKLLIHILISYAPYIVLSGKKDNFLICKIRWCSFCLTLFEKFNLSFILELVLYAYILQCLIILAFFCSIRRLRRRDSAAAAQYSKLIVWHFKRKMRDGTNEHFHRVIPSPLLCMNTHQLSLSRRISSHLVF